MAGTLANKLDFKCINPWERKDVVQQFIRLLYLISLIWLLVFIL